MVVVAVALVRYIIIFKPFFSFSKRKARPRSTKIAEVSLPQLCSLARNLGPYSLVANSIWHPLSLLPSSTCPDDCLLFYFIEDVDRESGFCLCVVNYRNW